MSNTGQGLGGIRDDLITLLAIPFGKSEAARKVQSLETLIQSKAKVGAEDAIPTIKLEVRKEIKPYIITAIVIGGLSFLVSIGSVIYTWRKSR